jgi:hemoglobin/transferrin/lactoferrin receptor protein
MAADLRDLLRYQPGISFDGGGTRFGGGGFRIRGLGGNRVVTLVDGIPVAERFTVGSYGDSGRDYTELGLVRQVEILRGPASNLYGSKALGGVVAIETLDPLDLLAGPHLGGHNALIYGSDRDQSGAAAASAFGLPDGALLLAATLRRGHELDAAGADELDPQDRERQSLLAKSTLGTNLGTLRLLLDYGRERRDTDLRAILGTGRFANTTSLLAADAQHAWRVGAQLEQDDADGARRLWRAWATDAWLAQDSDELRPLAPTPVRQQRRFEFAQRAAGLGHDARQPFMLLGARHTLGYGVEGIAGRLEESRDALETKLADGSQTQVLLGESFPRRDFPVTDTLELGAYMQAELRVPGGLTLMPGLRYDHHRLDARPDALFTAGSPNVATTDLRTDAWTPRLGVLYPIAGNLGGFAQYARGFRAPPAYDVNLGIDIVSVNARALPNPDLRPERSEAYEIGLRWRGGPARAELTAFETHYQDFILSNGFIGTDPETGTRLFQSRNVDRALIRGVELRWRQDLDALGAPLWSAELAGAWLEGSNRDTDQPLPTIDPARAVFALDRETGVTALRLRFTAVDDQSDTDPAARLFQAPGYSVVDLIGEYRPQPRLALRAGMFNALDRQYWEWSEVYGRSATDPLLPLLARAGRYFSLGAQLTF